MMRKLILSLAAILLIGTLAACNQDEKQKDAKERITPVETVEATEGDLVIEKYIYGRTAPNSTTPVMIQTPGEVDTLEVAEGDSVEEDDILAKIKTPMGTQNIRAPKAGTIVNLTAEEGEMLSNENPLAVIADMETMKLQFTVTSAMHSFFAKDDKRKVILNDKEYEAVVKKVGSMPDDTGLFPIEATVKNKDANMLPGTVAKMHIPVERVKKAIIVPTAAIVDEGDESFVFIISDEKAIKTKIEVKETQSDKTAIEGDVKKGDMIVVNGQLTLSDGNKVNVVEAGE